MIPYIIAIASSAVGQAAAADAKRRLEQGLPPIQVEHKEIKPTFEDRFWEAMIYVFILGPGILMGLLLAGLLFGLLKAFFASKGMAFP